MTTYKLRSFLSGNEFDDSGWLLEAPGEDNPSLIRAIYNKKQITVRDDTYGLYKFADWLPIHKELQGSSAPVTYKSKGLASYLGLRNLFITFSGYWPERHAHMTTCAFKETEAYTVGARLNGIQDKILVVASAGNTARAFAKVCSDNKIPLVICMPEDTLDAMWFEQAVDDCVKLLVTRSGSDYFDAIHLSNLVCSLDGFIPEGGAKNVARRDGMATTVLSAAAHIGSVPDYYFQAIGSGTGAIAAWEANLRLLDDGRFGNRKMKLMLSQNYPFIPMHDAWKAASRHLLPLDDSVARSQVMEIDAKVLSNRKPPYTIPGGLFDAMCDCGGEIMHATNAEARAASALFKDVEGMDIHPAAAVATASLIEQVNLHAVDPQSVVMLNITGGGEERFKAEHDLVFMKPHIVFDINPEVEYLADQLKLHNIGINPCK